MSTTSLKVVPSLPATPEGDGRRETKTEWKHGWTRTVGEVTTYYVRERRGGKQYEFSVGTDLDDANARWALFDKDPLNYVTPRKQLSKATRKAKSEGPVCLDADTLKAFLGRCAAMVEAGKMSHSHYRYTLVAYLSQWAAALKGQDLHEVTLDDLQALLTKESWQPGQHKRIVALKSFAAWARQEKPAPKLRRNSDPTLDLKTPPIPSGKRQKYELGFVANFYKHVNSQTARDMMRVRALANGMHDTEIAWFAQSDEAEIREIYGDPVIKGVLTFWQDKKKEWHAVSVDAETLAAAKRLKEGGVLSKTAYHSALHEAAIAIHGCGGVRKTYTFKTGRQAGQTYTKIRPCKKCRRLHPNRLRASFATWAHTLGEIVHPVGQKGVDLEKVAERMGHLNSATTKRHYVGDHVPDMIRIPLKLEHPQDPK